MAEKVEEKEYTPMLEGNNIVKIHPSIDFKEKAYFGIWLPAKEDERELFCIVNSHRELLQKSALQTSNARTTHQPLKFEARWSANSIKEFLASLNIVDPKELFEEIKLVYESFIDFPHLDFISLWVIGTYLFPSFRSYPYVYIGGISQSGKTKLLQVTALLAFNSIFSNNMSTSAIFRLIQNARCSLFIDESEKLVNPERNLDMRSILLQGYKSGAKVYRTEKNSREKFVVESFEVYSPKMLANISGIEDVLESRCIRFVMKRTINRQIGNSEVDESNSLWQDIRDKLYVFALENWDGIKELYLALPNETQLSNREWELWRPILALAVFIDNELYQRMKSLAEEKSGEKHVENMTETGEYILAETLLAFVEKDDFYKVKDIRDSMTAKFDEDQKWLTNKWVGNALRRFGFTEKRRVGTGIEYKLAIKSVQDLAERLQIRSSPQSLNAPHTPAISEHSEGNEVSAGENKSESSGQGEVSDSLNSKQFTFLPNSEIGVCSYCGKQREVLFWKDSKGNWLCEDCKISEMRK